MGKRHKPEEIIAKLRQVEVMTGQGTSMADAIRSIGVTEVTYYRWRSEYGGMKLDQEIAGLGCHVVGEPELKLRPELIAVWYEEEGRERELKSMRE